MRVSLPVNLTFLLLVLLFPKPASGQSEEAQARFDEILEEHAEALRAYTDSFDDPRSNLEYPTPKYAERIYEIFVDYPDDPVGFEAALWVLKANIRTGQALKDDIIAAFIDDHIESERMAEVIDHPSTIRQSLLADEFLTAVVEHNPSETAKALALFNLGFDAQGQYDALVMAEHDPGVRKMIEAIDLIDENGDPDALREEALAYFRQIVADPAYAVIRSKMYGEELGEMASRSIYKLENIAPGLPAPEIEGEDIDGVSFRLSDYRGKVVVLDFWGDW